MKFLLSTQYLALWTRFVRNLLSFAANTLFSGFLCGNQPRLLRKLRKLVRNRFGDTGKCQRLSTDAQTAKIGLCSCRICCIRLRAIWKSKALPPPILRGNKATAEQPAVVAETKTANFACGQSSSSFPSPFSLNRWRIWRMFIYGLANEKLRTFLTRHDHWISHWQSYCGCGSAWSRQPRRRRRRRQPDMDLTTVNIGTDGSSRSSKS